MAGLDSELTEAAAGTEAEPGAEAGREAETGEKEQPKKPLLELAQLQWMLDSRANLAVEEKMHGLYEALIPALAEAVRSMLPELKDPETGQPIEPMVQRNDSVPDGHRGMTPPVVSSKVNFAAVWETPAGAPLPISNEQFTNLAASVAALYGLHPDEWEVSVGRYYRGAKATNEAGMNKAGADNFLFDNREAGPRLSISMPITALLDGVSEGERDFYEYRALAEEKAALEQRAKTINEGPGGLSELYEKLMNKLKGLLSEVCPTIKRDGVSYKPSFTATKPFHESPDAMDPERMVEFCLQYTSDDPGLIDATLHVLTTDELEALAEGIALLYGDNVKAGREQTKLSGSSFCRRIVTVAGDEQESSARVLVSVFVRAPSFGRQIIDNYFYGINCFVPLRAVTRGGNIPIESRRRGCAEAAQDAMKEQ